MAVVVETGVVDTTVEDANISILPTFSASLCRIVLSLPLPSLAFLPFSSVVGGLVSPDNGDLQYELFHGFSQQRCQRESPVFVTLPVDSMVSRGAVRRPKAMGKWGWGGMGWVFG
ncbi:hypothetical protein TB1_024921 [Malus domestica]